jgi:LacI family transcriptional regulator
MAVSLRDISVRTGVNICSISQVLNDHPRAQSLRPETRAKILAAAQELGYCRNELAASVARRHGNVLAFVSGSMGGIEYTGRIQNGVLDAASARGYTVTVHHLGQSSSDEIIRRLIGWRVAGVIFHVPRLSMIQQMTEVLDRHAITWGTVNLSNPGGIGVTTDDTTGMEDAVRLLADYGHRKILFFANMKHPLYDQTEYQVRREAGFRQGMLKYYPGQEPVVHNLKTSLLLYDNAYMRKLAAKFIREKFDGVICESDLFASALGRAAISAGYSLPDAFSLIGFGDSIYSVAAYPCLTTIAQDFEKMGEDTVNFVTDIIEKKNLKKTHNTMLPVKIKERDSVQNRHAVGQQKGKRK